MKRKVKCWALHCYDVIFGETSEIAVFGDRKLAQSILEAERSDNPHWSKDAKLKIIPCTITYKLPKKKKGGK